MEDLEVADQHGGKFYRTSLIKENNIEQPTSLKVFEDGIFNLYTNYYSRKTIFIKEGLYHYRVNDLSATHSINKEQDIQNMEIIKQINEFIKNKNLNLKDSIYYNVLDLNMITFHFYTQKREKNDFKNLYNTVIKYDNYFKDLENKNLNIKEKIFVVAFRNKFVLLILYYIYLIKNNIRRQK